jgi:glutamate:GABA antiporter
MTSVKSAARRLGLFSIIMITVGSVDSIRNLPATALFGSSLIFFFLLGAVLFLIPCALVSAELSTMWTRDGGVYVWIKEAFGRQVGFIAIWFQWIENVIWYPTILSFVASTIGYLIDPSLATNKYFLISVILVAFWLATAINLLGMRSSAFFASFCSIAGVIIPMLVIIGLGAVWAFEGRPLHIEFTVHSMVPSLQSSDMWVAMIGVMLSFSGMEIATVHVRDARDPQHVFPRAIMYAAAIILGTLLFGALAIAAVIPHDQISLVSGIMEAFDVFFTAYHMAWIMPLIAIVIVIGGMGGVSNWIIAPTKGLLIAGQDGNLPVCLQQENKYGAPAVLLLYQAVIVSFLTLVFLLMPSINGSYWLLTALTAQLYMFMYILMFAAGIYLRYSHREQARPFKVLGGNWGMWAMGLAGIATSVGTVVVGFIPPPTIDVGGAQHYITLLTVGLVVMTLPPFIVYRFRKESWLKSAYQNG